MADRETPIPLTHPNLSADACVRLALLDHLWIAVADGAACSCYQKDRCPHCRAMLALGLGCWKASAATESALADEAAQIYADAGLVKDAVSGDLRDLGGGGRASAYHNGPAWQFFGLSYAAYLVMPRVAVCSMPIAWQASFIALLKEAQQALADGPLDGAYSVRKREAGRFVDDPLTDYRHVGPLPLRAAPKKRARGAAKGRAR